MGSLVVKGARVHNLKSVDVEIPRDKLVVVTGLSGSGKSSLAFDTIYAEGQRRYVESLSPYARQFLEQMGKPDVDSIEGLSPAIAIQQRAASRNPRSTVGTITEIHDYLRLLYARAGRVHCYQCGREIRAQTVQQMVDGALELPTGARFSVIAPVIRDVEGKHRRVLERLRRSGYLRVAVDGDLIDLSEGIPELDRRKRHDVDVYVDRLVVKSGIRQRLTDSVELALGLAGGLLRILPVDGEALVFSERCACIDCGVSYPEIEPRMFSFNSPHGACPGCDGLGVQPFVDPDLVVPDKAKSVRDGAIEPWSSGRRSGFYTDILEAVCDHFAIDMDKPWRELSDSHRGILLRGHDEEVELVVVRGKKKTRYTRAFGGVLAALERKGTGQGGEGKGGRPAAADEISRYQSHSTCASCQGARLRRESRHVKVGGRTLPEVCALPVAQSLPFLGGLDAGLDRRERAVAGSLLREITARLGFLASVGLDYLALERAAATLSSGEAQRIRLATQIGSSLVGVLYVLDEPSIGLHARDNERLLDALRRLRDAGNTVLVVEHDEATIRLADYVIDMGLRAGVHGGRVVAAGEISEIEASPESLTGKYLRGELTIPIPEKRRVTGKHLVIRGAREHNLKDVTVRFPIGLFTCVTGVSGSGKSTLVMDTLRPALQQRLGRKTSARRGGAGALGAGAHDAFEGAHHVDRLVAIDQTPIGRTPRSNPATYTGLLKLIRDLFARLPESRARGYKAGRYSFNVKGGRCEACLGDGLLRIEMNFLPDLYVQCDACKGRRFNRETLEVRFKGMSIADVLDMTVDEALEVLANVPKARALLETLRDVGLGYITLGQSATTLSGGEAQRLKLSRELAKQGVGRTLYILDEPTTGLHFDDIRQLLRALNLLVDKGNSAVVIEHNLEVIKSADHVIDLGPEGGEAGGQLVAAGAPEEIARVERSHTGRFLRDLLRLPRANA